MKAFYTLACNNAVLEQQIIDNFMGLNWTDDVGFESDGLDIELDNSKGQIDALPRGARLRLSLGLRPHPAHFKGEFILDQSAEDLINRSVTLQAQSADMLSPAKVLRSQAHIGNLSDALTAIASRNGWTLALSGYFSGVNLPWTAQQGESDMHFISRLAQIYHATSGIKNNTLLFVEKNSQYSASGQRLPAFHVPLKGAAAANYQELGRNYYTGVSAYFRDENSENDQQIEGTVRRGSMALVYALRETFSNREQAIEAAEAEMARINGNENTLSMSYAAIDPIYQAGAVADLSGDFPKKIRDQAWSIKAVRMSLNASNSLSGDIECVRSANLAQ